MLELLLGVLQSGFSLWETMEKDRYLNQLVDLKNRYYEEQNKPDSIRDDSVLDNIEHELRVLASVFTAGPAKQDAKTQP